MKKMIGIWTAALAASVLSFAACSEKIDEPASQNATRTIKVTANVELDESGSDVSTRANWVDFKGLQWEESDATKLGLIDDKNGINASTAMTIATDGTAVFTGEVKDEATKFLASYPKVNAGVNDGCSTIYFNIASAQTQAAAGAMESADGKVAMVGKAPIELSSATEYSASMRMISSLARFLVYSTEGKTDKVKSVSVTSDQNIAGARVAIVNWSNEGNYEFNGGEVSKTATVTLTEQFDLNGITSMDNTKGIYLGLIPATSTATTYTVTTDKGAYTFTPSSNVEFKAGIIYDIPLNLDRGTYASTENEVIFTPGVTADQGVNANANKLYLGATTATCGGEAVTMNADDCVLVAIGDDGNAASWVTPFWENTNNYNLGISIEKNKTTSARAAKIYMEYKGTRSKNYINVRQDAGTGLPTIVPTLSGAYTTEIVYGGETVANAATLSLTVDGEAKSGADVDAYLSYLTISCGAATASCSNGVISLVFPENTTTSAKTYTLSVKSEDGSATLSFNQAANPDAEGGETESHTFEYKIAQNGEASFSISSAAYTSGHIYQMDCLDGAPPYVKIDDKTYAPGQLGNIETDGLYDALVNHLFTFVELTDDDMKDASDPKTSVADMKAAVSFTYFDPKGAALYFMVGINENTTGARRTFKIQCNNADGTVCGTRLIYQD